MNFKKQFYWLLFSATLVGAPAMGRDNGRGNGRGNGRARPAVANAQVMRTAFDRDDHRRDRDRDDRRWNRDRDDRRRDTDRDRDDWNRNRTYRTYPNYGYYPNRTYNYNPYPYNDPNYNYNGYGNNNTYQLGYRDGLNLGRRDYANGNGYNPRRYDRVGDSNYRAGFDAGYRDGFGRRW